MNQKAIPLKEKEDGKGYLICSIEKATHVLISIPRTSGNLILSLSRWTWNRDEYNPTLSLPFSPRDFKAAISFVHTLLLEMEW